VRDRPPRPERPQRDRVCRADAELRAPDRERQRRGGRRRRRRRGVHPGDVIPDVVKGPFVRHVVGHVEGVPQGEAERDVEAAAVVIAGGGRHRAPDGIIRGVGLVALDQYFIVSELVSD